MSKSRMVKTTFWSDPWVVDKLNPLDRYIFVYLLTNSQTNMAGIYELSLRVASFETGIERDNLEKIIKRLSPKIEYKDSWVYIRRFIDHQQNNPSIQIAIRRVVQDLPEHVKNWIMERGISSEYLALLLHQGSQDSVSTDSPQSGGNFNSNSNLNTKSGKNTPKSKKVKNEKKELDFDGFLESFNFGEV